MIPVADLLPSRWKTGALNLSRWRSSSIKSNSVDELSFVELRRVFLGERSHWSNGRRITLVMREPGEPERRAILRDVCGMSEDQFETHILRGLFTGDILVSPKILAAPSGVRKFLFNVPGAIGYLR